MSENSKQMCSAFAGRDSGKTILAENFGNCVCVAFIVVDNLCAVMQFVIKCVKKV